MALFSPHWRQLCSQKEKAPCQGKTLLPRWAMGSENGVGGGLNQATAGKARHQAAVPLPSECSVHKPAGAAASLPGS